MANEFKIEVSDDLALSTAESQGDDGYAVDARKLSVYYGDFSGLKICE